MAPEDLLNLDRIWTNDDGGPSNLGPSSELETMNQVNLVRSFKSVSSKKWTNKICDIAKSKDEVWKKILYPKIVA